MIRKNTVITASLVCYICAPSVTVAFEECGDVHIGCVGRYENFSTNSAIAIACSLPGRTTRALAYFNVFLLAAIKEQCLLLPSSAVVAGSQCFLLNSGRCERWSRWRCPRRTIARRLIAPPGFLRALFTHVCERMLKGRFPRGRYSARSPTWPLTRISWGVMCENRACTIHSTARRARSAFRPNNVK